jgi:hypothetical protein
MLARQRDRHAKNIENREKGMLARERDRQAENRE